MAVLSAACSWAWPRDAAASEGDGSRVELAFELADTVEKGLARENGAEFMRPLRRSSRLWRFNVVRSEDKLEYRLLSDDGAFLMYAHVSVADRRARLYLYDRLDKLHDPSRPAFSLIFCEARSDWRLVQERCDNCGHQPRHLSCTELGRQQVAAVQHYKETVGGGVRNAMHVQVPGIYADGGQVVWCPRLGRGDLAQPEADAGSPAAGSPAAGSPSPAESRRARKERLFLVSRRPEWSSDAQSLILDFRGRSVVSSAKNFQLALRQKPDHVICQFGKLAEGTFALDFKYPLSVVQAFGICITTLFWT